MRVLISIPFVCVEFQVSGGEEKETWTHVWKGAWELLAAALGLLEWALYLFAHFIGRLYSGVCLRNVPIVVSLLATSVDDKWALVAAQSLIGK